jgi:hypothetical protein
MAVLTDRLGETMQLGKAVAVNVPFVGTLTSRGARVELAFRRELTSDTPSLPAHPPVLLTEEAVSLAKSIASRETSAILRSKGGGQFWSPSASVVASAGSHLREESSAALPGRYIRRGGTEGAPSSSNQGVDLIESSARLTTVTRVRPEHSDSKGPLAWGAEEAEEDTAIGGARAMIGFPPITDPVAVTRAAPFVETDSDPKVAAAIAGSIIAGEAASWGGCVPDGTADEVGISMGPLGPYYVRSNPKGSPFAPTAPATDGASSDDSDAEGARALPPRSSSVSNTSSVDRIGVRFAPGASLLRFAKDPTVGVMWSSSSLAHETTPPLAVAEQGEAKVAEVDAWKAAKPSVSIRWGRPKQESVFARRIVSPRKEAGSIALAGGIEVAIGPAADLASPRGKLGLKMMTVRQPFESLSDRSPHRPPTRPATDVLDRYRHRRPHRALPLAGDPALDASIAETRSAAEAARRVSLLASDSGAVLASHESLLGRRRAHAWRATMLPAQTVFDHAHSGVIASPSVVPCFAGALLRVDPMRASLGAMGRFQHSTLLPPMWEPVFSPAADLNLGPLPVGGAAAVVDVESARVVAISVGPWVIPTTALQSAHVRSALASLNRRWGGKRLALPSSSEAPLAGKPLAAVVTAELLSLSQPQSVAPEDVEHPRQLEQCLVNHNLVDDEGWKRPPEPLAQCPEDMFVPLAAGITVPENSPIIRGWRKFAAYIAGADSPPGAAPPLSVASGAISPMREEWRANILHLLPDPSKTGGCISVHTANAILGRELGIAKSFYEAAARRSILLYVLRSPLERLRLGIPTVPSEVSVVSQRWEYGGQAAALRGRVAGPLLPREWSHRLLESRTKLAQSLYTMTGAARQLHDRWVSYRAAGALSLLVDVPRTDAEALQGWKPQSLGEFVRDQLRHAATTRQSYMERWAAQAERTLRQYLEARGSPPPDVAQALHESAADDQSIDAAWANVRMNSYVPELWHGPDGFRSRVLTELRGCYGPGADSAFDSSRLFSTLATELSLQLREVCEESVAALLAFFLRFARRRQRLRLPALVSAARRRVRRQIAEDRKRDAAAEREKRELRKKERERAAARAALEQRKVTFREGSLKATLLRGPINEDKWKELQEAHDKALHGDDQGLAEEALEDMEQHDGTEDEGKGLWMSRLPPRQRRAIQRRQRAVNALRRGVTALRRAAGVVAKASQEHLSRAGAQVVAEAAGGRGRRRSSLGIMEGRRRSVNHRGGSVLQEAGLRAGRRGSGLVSAVLMSMMQDGQHSEGVSSAVAGIESDEGELSVDELDEEWDAAIKSQAPPSKAKADSSHGDQSSGALPTQREAVDAAMRRKQERARRTSETGQEIRRKLADALLRDEGVAPLIGAPPDEENVLSEDYDAPLLLRRGFLEFVLGLSFAERLWHAVFPRGASLVTLVRPGYVPSSIPGTASIGMGGFDPSTPLTRDAGLETKIAGAWTDSMQAEAARAASVASLTADVNGVLSADAALEASRRGGLAALQLLAAGDAQRRRSARTLRPLGAGAFQGLLRGAANAPEPVGAMLQAVGMDGKMSDADTLLEVARRVAWQQGLGGEGIVSALSSLGQEDFSPQELHAETRWGPLLSSVFSASTAYSSAGAAALRPAFKVVLSSERADTGASSQGDALLQYQYAADAEDTASPVTEKARVEGLTRQRRGSVGSLTLSHESIPSVRSTIDLRRMSVDWASTNTPPENDSDHGSLGSLSDIGEGSFGAESVSGAARKFCFEPSPSAMEAAVLRLFDAVVGATHGFPAPGAVVKGDVPPSSSVSHASGRVGAAGAVPEWALDPRNWETRFAGRSAYAIKTEEASSAGLHRVARDDSEEEEEDDDDGAGAFVRRQAGKASAVAIALSSLSPEESLRPYPGFDKARQLSSEASLLSASKQWKRPLRTTGPVPAAVRGGAPKPQPSRTGHRKFLWGVSWQDPLAKRSRLIARHIVRKAMQDAAVVLELFAPFEFLLTEDERLGEFLASRPSLDECDRVIAQYSVALKDLESGCHCPEELALDLVLVETGSMSRSLREAALALIHRVLKHTEDTAESIFESINSRFKTLNQRLHSQPSTPGDLVQAERSLFEASTTELPRLYAEERDAHELLQFLFRHGHSVGRGCLEQAHIAAESRQQIAGVTKAFSEQLTRTRTKLESDVRSRKDNVLQSMSVLEEHLLGIRERGDWSAADAIVAQLTELERELSTVDAIVSQVHNDERTLGLSMTAFKEVGDNRALLQPLLKLWQTAASCEAMRGRWERGPVFKLDSAVIVSSVEKMQRVGNSLKSHFESEGALEAATIGGRIVESVERFKRHLPLLMVVCNRGMQERHWQQVSAVVRLRVRPDATTTLHKLRELGFDDKIEKLTAISEEATRQFSIQQALEAMQAEWDACSFDLQPYKATDVRVLTSDSSDAMHSLTQDHAVRLQTVRGSRYAEPFGAMIDALAEQLRAVKRLLHSWMAVQGAWVQLHRVLASPDVQRQMPEEAAKFEVVDDNWRGVSQKAASDPRVKSVLTIPMVQPRLEEAEAMIDEIRAGVNAYLDSKRVSFPRLFFLSRADLLSLLAEMRDPSRVVPFLRVCFEGIHSLLFDGETLEQRRQKDWQGDEARKLAEQAATTAEPADRPTGSRGGPKPIEEEPGAITRRRTDGEHRRPSVPGAPPPAKVVTALVSAEGEIVPLRRPVDTVYVTNRGAGVEGWLSLLESCMRGTMRAAVGSALGDPMAVDPDARIQWAMEWPAQAVQAASRVLWTASIERLLRDSAAYEAILASNHSSEDDQVVARTSAAEIPDRLEQSLRLVESHVTRSVRAVRGKLSPLQRRALSALLVLDVHARDVTRDVAAAAVDGDILTPGSFVWSSALRYYYFPGHGGAAADDGDDEAIALAATNDKSQRSRWREPGSTKSDRPSTEKKPPQVSRRDSIGGFAAAQVGVSGGRWDVLDIHMLSARTTYLWEYSGVAPRLVVTPLTERAFRTLLLACQAALGGAPEGPAGTGKTETVKDLARTSGRHCLVLNCSEEMEALQLGKTIEGLASCGSWACFDEFNRINISVLSMIATYVSALQRGIATGSRQVFFQGTRVKLLPTAAVFITMNPGYAGRVELPDNVKALFRPLSMTQPDAVIIAENLLFSEGFLHAHSLAVKLTAAFRLSKEQLSERGHYDWGLRSQITTLREAGSVRRGDISLGANGGQVEDTGVRDAHMVDQAKTGGAKWDAHLEGHGEGNGLQDALFARTQKQNKDSHDQSVGAELAYLLKALRKTVEPRITATDIPLFRSILGDLFSEASSEPVEEPSVVLAHAAARAAWKLGLQPTARLISNVVTLSDLMTCRPGVALIGPVASGKSTSLVVLQSAMFDLVSARQAANKSEDKGGDAPAPEAPKVASIAPWARTVDAVTMRPGALTIEELFGVSDPATGEWIDGALAMLYRGASRRSMEGAAGGTSAENRRAQWIVFDGPAESRWMDSLNTVLDDSRRLTLPSGEILPLQPDTNMVVESLDLRHASPAAVTRCGVLVHEHWSVGWRPVVASWLESLHGALGHSENKALLLSMFETLMDPAMALVLGGRSVAAGTAPFTSKVDAPLSRLMREAGVRPGGEAAVLLRGAVGGLDGAGGELQQRPSERREAGLLNDNDNKEDEDEEEDALLEAALVAAASGHGRGKGAARALVGTAADASVHEDPEARSDLPLDALSEASLATQMLSILDQALIASANPAQSSDYGIIFGRSSVAGSGAGNSEAKDATSKSKSRSKAADALALARPGVGGGPGALLSSRDSAALAAAAEGMLGDDDEGSASRCLPGMDSDDTTAWIEMCFVHSLVWGVTSHLSEDGKKRFDAWVRAATGPGGGANIGAIARGRANARGGRGGNVGGFLAGLLSKSRKIAVPLPVGGSAYEFTLTQSPDGGCGSWVKVSSMVDTMHNVPVVPGQSLATIVLPTPVTLQLARLLQDAVLCGRNSLLVGDGASGKTVALQAVLNAMTASLAIVPSRNAVAPKDEAGWKTPSDGAGTPDGTTGLTLGHTSSRTAARDATASATGVSEDAAEGSIYGRESVGRHSTGSRGTRRTGVANQSRVTGSSITGFQSITSSGRESLERRLRMFEGGTDPSDTNIFSVEFSLSSQTTANQLRSVVEAGLHRHGPGVLAAGPSSAPGSLVVMVDDLHLAQAPADSHWDYTQDESLDTTAVVAAHEALTSLMSTGGWVSPQADGSARLHRVVEAMVLSAMRPSSSMDPRLARLFHSVSVEPMTDAVLTSILSNGLAWEAKRIGLSDSVVRAVRGVVPATVQVIRRAMTLLLPTPVRPHYGVTPRSAIRILNGVCLAPLAAWSSSPEHIARLWIHEALRELGDKLVGSDDRMTLLATVRSLARSAFAVDVDRALARLDSSGDGRVDTPEEASDLLFADFLPEEAPAGEPTVVRVSKTGGQHNTGESQEENEWSDASMHAIQLHLRSRGRLLASGVGDSDKRDGSTTAEDETDGFQDEEENAEEAEPGEAVRDGSRAEGANLGPYMEIPITTAVSTVVPDDAEDHTSSATMEDDALAYTKAGFGRLTRMVERFVEEYNAVNARPLTLTVFRYGIQHLCRISRALRLATGHAVLIGKPGSSRRSLVRLAAYMSGHELLEITPTAGYDTEDWRLDLRRLVKRCVFRAHSVVLLVSDTQLSRVPGALDDIARLMSTGDLPELLSPGERAVMAERMRGATRTILRAERVASVPSKSSASATSGGGEEGVADAGSRLFRSGQLMDVEPTVTDCWREVQRRIRCRLHVALCLGTGTDSLRALARHHHAVLECASVDFFEPLPLNALAAVAHARLSRPLIDCAPAAVPTALDAQSASPGALIAPPGSVNPDSSTLPQLDDPFTPAVPWPVGSATARARRVVEICAWIHQDAAATALALNARSKQRGHRGRALDLGDDAEDEQQAPLSPAEGVAQAATLEMEGPLTPVSPASFVEMISVFARLLRQKSSVLAALRSRYQNGVAELRRTTKEVAAMSQRLAELKPTLHAHAAQTSSVLRQVEDERRAVNDVREQVALESRVANSKRDEAQAMKAECDADLAGAMPAMNAALAAVDGLRKQDIVEVKSMGSPPAGVRLVMQAVCILFNLKPRKGGADASKAADSKGDYWPVAKTSLLGDPRFLQRLVEFDRDNIDDKVIRAVMPVVADPMFDPTNMKQASTAAYGLSLWVRAIVSYHEALKVVLPKRERAKAQEEELSALTRSLEAKQAELERVEERLQELSDRLEASKDRKRELEDAVETTNIKMQRARQLTRGMGGEARRWKAEIVRAAASQKHIVGDCLLVAASVAYLGALGPGPRLAALRRWHAAIARAGVGVTVEADPEGLLLSPLTWHSSSTSPHSAVTDEEDLGEESFGEDDDGTMATPQVDPGKAFFESAGEAVRSGPGHVLERTLDDPVQVQTWRLAGLSPDAFSVENAVITVSARRWPLLVDPQGQAASWVRELEHEAGLVVADISSADALHRVEAAIQLGQPVLLSGVGVDSSSRGDFPAWAEPVLRREVVRKGEGRFVSVGGKLVPYADGFRMYLRSPVAAPRLSAEAATLVTVVNFALTWQGVHHQMLGATVGEERAELEEDKTRIVLELSEYRAQLRSLEEKVLSLLSSEGGDLLNDSEAIDALQDCKRLSDAANKRRAIAEETERRIDEAREAYGPLASLATALFFAADSLARVRPFYRFSIDWMKHSLVLALRRCERAVQEKLNERLGNVSALLRQITVGSLLRSSLEEDRSVVLLTVTVRLSALQGRGHLPLPLLRYILDGTTTMLSHAPRPRESVALSPAPGLHVPGWMTPKQFHDLRGLVSAASDSIHSWHLGTLAVGNGLSDAKLIVDELWRSLDSAYTDPEGGEGQFWRSLVDGALSPLRCEFPGPLNDLTPLGRFCVARTLCLRRVQESIELWARAEIGPSAVLRREMDLSHIARSASPHQPVLFFLAPGSELTARLRASAAGMGATLEAISLGATNLRSTSLMIAKAAAEGQWLLLENTHLAPAWMPTLLRLVSAIRRLPVTDDTDGAYGMGSTATVAVSALPGSFVGTEDDDTSLLPAAVNTSFRLFLTVTNEASPLPVPLIQLCEKIAMEARTGSLRSAVIAPLLAPPLSVPAFFTPQELENIDIDAGFIRADDGPTAIQKAVADASNEEEEEEAVPTSAEIPVEVASRLLQNEILAQGGWLGLFQRLAYSLVLFHVAVVERSSFGRRGWTSPVTFTQADLNAGLHVLRDIVTSAAVQSLSTDVDEQGGEAPTDDNDDEEDKPWMDETDPADDRPRSSRRGNRTPGLIRPKSSRSMQTDESSSPMWLLPYDTLRCAIGDCIYGGRLSNSTDHRALVRLLHCYLSPVVHASLRASEVVLGDLKAEHLRQLCAGWSLARLPPGSTHEQVDQLLTALGTPVGLQHLPLMNGAHTVAAAASHWASALEGSGNDKGALDTLIAAGGVPPNAQHDVCLRHARAAVPETATPLVAGLDDTAGMARDTEAATEALLAASRAGDPPFESFIQLDSELDATSQGAAAPVEDRMRLIATAASVAAAVLLRPRAHPREETSAAAAAVGLPSQPSAPNPRDSVSAVAPAPSAVIGESLIGQLVVALLNAVPESVSATKAALNNPLVTRALPVQWSMLKKDKRGRAGDTAGATEGVGIGRVITIDPLSVLLQQEISSFNECVETVQNSLESIRDVLLGAGVGSDEDHSVIAALRSSRVPNEWLVDLPPTRRLPLPWIKWLRRRGEMLEHWADEGRPAVLWLGGFARPEALPSILLQKHARDVGLPADAVRMECVVRSDITDDTLLPVKDRRLFLPTVEAQDEAVRTVKAASALFGDKFTKLRASNEGSAWSKARMAASKLQPVGTGTAAARAAHTAAALATGSNLEDASGSMMDSELREWGSEWDDAARPREIPEDGILIGGLTLEAARWVGGAQAGSLSLPRAQRVTEQCPVLWLVPVLRVDDDEEGNADLEGGFEEGEGTDLEGRLLAGPGGTAPTMMPRSTRDTVWSGMIRWRPRGAQFACPVFRDRQRKTPLFSVHLPCSSDLPPAVWGRQGAAVVLDGED